MQIIHDVPQLQSVIAKLKSQGKSIGFVPTMGALHSGHISLINQAAENCDIVVCSIFVNPTQFDNKDDLTKYPRTLDTDAQLLVKNGTHILFAPGVDDIYPDGMDAGMKIDLNGLDKVMEGEFREGHFDGVVQVVHRLLDIVKPDELFMGQKDFQQFTIIQYMIDLLEMPIKLVVCPIMREDHGLAMSSRNVRLSPEMREKAAILYKTLKSAKRNLKKKPVSEIIEKSMKKLSKPPFKAEYFKIVNGHTLRDIKSIEESDYIVACLAVWAGDVRLIDNMILKTKK